MNSIGNDGDGVNGTMTGKIRHLDLAWQDLVSVLVLFALLLSINGGAVTQGFVADDDPIILAYAITHNPWDYFFNPHRWQALTMANLTPWLVLDFSLDYALFGLNAAGYYAHVLLYLSLCATLMYVLLRHYTARPWAFCASTLFVLAPPTASLAHELMSRHYVSGLLFGLLSALFYIKALSCTKPRIRQVIACLGALAYLMALSSKEVYALIPLILLALPRESIPRKIKLLAPYALSAAIYLVWRRWMLGEWLGGYGGGNNNPVLVEAAIFMGLSALHCWHVRRLSLWLIAPIALLLPLLPVYGALWVTPRYQFVPTILLAVVITLLFEKKVKTYKTWRIPVALLLITAGLTLAVLSQHAVQNISQRAHKQQVMDQPFWVGDGGWLVWVPVESAYQHVKGIENIRELTQHGHGTPQFIYDEIQLRHVAHHPQSIQRYDEAAQNYVDYEQQLPKTLAAWCGSLRQAPLSIDISYNESNHFLNWVITPVQAGTYKLVSVGGSAIAMPVMGRARIHIENPQFYIRYNAPDGWVTYSDLLTIPANGSLHWQRQVTGGSAQSLDQCVVSAYPVVYNHGL